MKAILLLVFAVLLGATEGSWLSEKQKQSRIAKVCLDNKVFYYSDGNLIPKLEYISTSGYGSSIVGAVRQTKCKERGTK